MFKWVSTVDCLKLLEKLACWGVLLAVFPVAGYVAGWLAGYSRTPGLGALIPIVLGLLSALTYGLLERTQKAAAITDRLEKALDATAFFKARDEIRKESHTSLWLPAFWALGVILFSVSCFWAVPAGVR